MKKSYIQIYKVVWKSDNTRTTEHRQKMEKHLGRKLSYNEVVHHKNENKLDNRLSNLEVKERGQHSTDHHTLPIEQKAIKRKCAYCNKEIWVSKARLRYKKRRTPYKFCSRSCGAKAQWKRGAVDKNIGKWSKRK